MYQENNNISEHNTNILDFLGNYAPWITFFGTIFIFLLKHTEFEYLQIFVIGFFINLFLNKFLKQYVCTTPINIRTNNYSRNTMPSGHSQSVFFTAFFLSLLIFRKLLKGTEYKTWLFIVYIFGIVSVYNCIRGEYHTIDQVEIGILFGYAVAYSFSTFI